MDAIDVKIAAQERQQDAAEDDSSDEECGTPSENEELGYDEPLIKDAYIPFELKENEGSIFWKPFFTFNRDHALC